MRKRNINIFSDELSTYSDQLNYKKAFLLKFGDKISSVTKDPFYFDDCDAIDENGERIPDIRLTSDTWNQITKKLINYFHITD